MPEILFLPTEGPHLPRTGPEEDFDWRVQCRMAAQWLRAHPDGLVYVPSAFRQAGQPSELDFYRDRLGAEGVPDSSMLLDPSGWETIEQCDLALALAADRRARLTVLTCASHAKRVRYLMRGRDVEHLVAPGTASPSLRRAHVVLGVLFPLLDKAGLRGWWMRWLRHRRLQGTQ